MPSKYRIILEMASQTARNIASNADRYTDFLITAANNYKYSFKEQLLIHAQKPDATACAEIDTWNKLGRWVNKGTKGIALLIDRDVPYVVLLFKATQWSGDLISSEEGQMEWIKYSDLSVVKTVDDFDDLLKVMNTPELTEFQYLVSGDEWTVSIR